MFESCGWLWQNVRTLSWLTTKAYIWQIRVHPISVIPVGVLREALGAPPVDVCYSTNLYQQHFEEGLLERLFRNLVTKHALREECAGCSSRDLHLMQQHLFTNVSRKSTRRKQVRQQNSTREKNENMLYRSAHDIRPALDHLRH